MYPHCEKLSYVLGFFIIGDVKRLEGWVRSETERYTALLDQRHDLEIDAFAEQLRLKDEKLEVLQWRLLSMELESKKLQTFVEGLNKDMSQLRHNNMKMESLLLERDEELTSLKEQFSSQLRSLNCQKNNMECSPNDSAAVHNVVWPEDKIIESPPEEEEEETKIICMETPQYENIKEEDGTVSQNQVKDVNLMVQSPDRESDVQNASPEGLIDERSASTLEGDATDKLASLPLKGEQPLNKTDSNSWKMDLHALGVSYKIKRLKQQLSMLEKLEGKKVSCEFSEKKDCSENSTKGLTFFLSLLNKQVGRYQSLQTKVDHLCKRMVSYILHSVNFH